MDRQKKQDMEPSLRRHEEEGGQPLREVGRLVRAIVRMDFGGARTWEGK